MVLEGPLPRTGTRGSPSPGLRGAAVLFLIFNEGYLASDPGKEAVRADLTAEGHILVRARLATGHTPGRYQILAAVNAVQDLGDREPGRRTGGDEGTTDRDRDSCQRRQVRTGRALRTRPAGGVP